MISCSVSLATHDTNSSPDDCESTQHSTASTWPLPCFRRLSTAGTFRLAPPLLSRGCRYFSAARDRRTRRCIRRRPICSLLSLSFGAPGPGYCRCGSSTWAARLIYVGGREPDQSVLLPLIGRGDIPPPAATAAAAPAHSASLPGGRLSRRSHRRTIAVRSRGSDGVVIVAGVAAVGSCCYCCSCGYSCGTARRSRGSAAPSASWFVAVFPRARRHRVGGHDRRLSEGEKKRHIGGRRNGVNRESGRGQDNIHTIATAGGWEDELNLQTTKLHPRAWRGSTTAEAAAQPTPRLHMYPHKGKITPSTDLIGAAWPTSLTLAHIYTRYGDRIAVAERYRHGSARRPPAPRCRPPAPLPRLRRQMHWHRRDRRDSPGVLPRPPTFAVKSETAGCSFAAAGGRRHRHCRRCRRKNIVADNGAVHVRRAPQVVLAGGTAGSGGGVPWTSPLMSLRVEL